MPVLFTFPICAIKAAHASDKTSCPFVFEITSLTMNSWELGDSDGERRRIDMGCGRRAVVSFRRWGMGLRDRDGIECDRVGDNSVGGSYLQNVQMSARDWPFAKSYRNFT
jgi:hypothetical protein